MIISPSTGGRRIPTLIGLALVVILVVAVGFTTQAVQKVTKIFSQADSSLTPKSLDTANITDTSVTIFWTTDKETSGAVFYGRSKSLGEGVALDDRDSTSANAKYATHLVRLNNLKPNTKYYYKVGVNSSTFGNPARNDDPYEITTYPTINSAVTIDPIFGKVLDATGGPIGGALAVWQSQGSGKIASLSKTDGSYVLPIGNASPAGGNPETITLDAGGGNLVATLSCKVGQDRPLPSIKLGETADCSKRTSSDDTSIGFKAPATTPVASPSAGTFTMNVNDGQTFNTALPTISGKAGPNQIIQIRINSETPYSGTVQAGPDGSWSWTPPANLSAGQHTVTITVVNPDGTTQTVSRTFTVSAGSPILPLTSGTPSAELTHLACVGSTCSTVAGAGPNTCALDNDCITPTLPTPAPTPPLPPPPATGSTETTLILLTMGLLFATLGIGVFLKR